MPKTIEELLHDEGFSKKLFGAKNDDEIKSLFKENGIELDDSKAAEIKSKKEDVLTTMKSMSNEELETVVAAGTGSVAVTDSKDREHIENGFIDASRRMGAAIGGLAGTLKGISDTIHWARGKNKGEVTATDVIVEAINISLKSFAGSILGSAAGTVWGATAVVEANH